jgi:hypothetical protein
MGNRASASRRRALTDDDTPTASVLQFTPPRNRSEPMVEIPLARLWSLPDGTSCLLLKDPAAENWRVRVTRGTEILRTEAFASPIVAMDEAKQWRLSFDRVFEAL